MKSFRIAVIPGDGMGKEVVSEGVRVLKKAAAVPAWLSLIAAALTAAGPMPSSCEPSTHRRAQSV
jgi:isocitrate/isopropylmalate dehydrogenase